MCLLLVSALVLPSLNEAWLDTECENVSDEARLLQTRREATQPQEAQEAQEEAQAYEDWHQDPCYEINAGVLPANGNAGYTGGFILTNITCVVNGCNQYYGVPDGGGWIDYCDAPGTGQTCCG